MRGLPTHARGFVTAQSGDGLAHGKRLAVCGRDERSTVGERGDGVRAANRQQVVGTRHVGRGEKSDGRSTARGERMGSLSKMH